MFEINCIDTSGNPISTLTQWDTNQRILIDKDYFNKPPVFHFCNKNSKEAIGVRSALDGEYIGVDIPNSLLKEALPIVVYVYETKNEGNGSLSGKTVQIINIPVRPRVKPTDVLFSDDRNVLYIQEVLDSVDTYRQEITNIYQFQQGLLTELDKKKNTLDAKKREVDTTISNANAKVGELNTVIGSANSSKAQAETTISNANRKKVELESTIGNATSKKSELENTIRELDKNVNRYSVGTTNNLFLGSKNFGGSWINMTDASRKDSFGEFAEEYQGVDIYKSRETWYGKTQEFNVKQGEVYTFSLWAKSSDTSTIMRMTIADKDFGTDKIRAYGGGNAFLQTTLTTDYVRYAYSFEVLKDCTINPRARKKEGNGEFYFGGLKLEYGNVATAWSPNPKDTYDYTDKKASDVRGYIDRKANELITSRVVDGWNCVTCGDSKMVMATKSVKIDVNQNTSVDNIFSIFKADFTLPTGVFNEEPLVYASVDQQSVGGYVLGCNVTWVTRTGFSVYWFKPKNSSGGEVDIKLTAIMTKV